MFSLAAPKYWSWYCHVGGSSDAGAGKIHGLGCRLGPKHVLTAAHVFEQYAFPTALLTDGLWKCSVERDWPSLDIALIRVETPLKKKGQSEEISEFPDLATRIPQMGTSLGYIGWLKLLDESGQSKGRTYFGQGHVAFFEKGLRGQTLLAVDGSAVEEGFSGGPAFTPDGILCGVLVEALQYAPKLGERGRQVNALPLVSPIASIRNEIQALLKEA